MSYEDVIAGLHERFATVEGLQVVLLGEPASADTAPLLYSVVSRGTRETPANLTRITYRTAHWLLISWGDPEEAERELLRLVNAIPASLNPDPKLRGRADDAEIVEWDAENPGWLEVGGVTHRVCVFWSRVIEFVSARGTL